MKNVIIFLWLACIYAMLLSIVSIPIAIFTFKIDKSIDIAFDMIYYLVIKLDLFEE